jgi:hypothetical protein
MFCQLFCPNLRCRKILKVPEEARGKVIRCEQCRTMLRVPEARQTKLAAITDIRGMAAAGTFGRRAA